MKKVKKKVKMSKFEEKSSGSGVRAAKIVLKVFLRFFAI